MKRFLLITSIILFTAVLAQGQSRPSRDASGPIVRLYPNPATSFVTIDFERGYDRGYSVQVFSFLGKKMYEATNLNDRTILNLADYNRGVYIYQLRDRTGRMVESGKFQVSK